jgi:hypothetical protein
LGLLDDYLGRDLVKDDKLDLAKIDIFYETEIDIMDYLDSLITVENLLRDKQNQIDKQKIRVADSNCTSCHAFSIYYSKKLAEEINSKYRFKLAKSWDTKDRKMYYGLLKTSSIKSANQKTSFLAGAYLKFGTHNGEIYKFRLANSPSKYKILIKTLKDLSCEIININVTKNSIPVSQTIEFKPTKDIKDQFDKLESLKLKVDLKKTTF